MSFYSGRSVFGSIPHGVYGMLGKFPPGLALDVGAAAGLSTETILKVSPQTRVIALEPFEGNHQYFNQRFAGNPAVKLIHAAASDKNATSKFHVPSTVKGTERGWEHMQGYSSLGMLVDDADKRTSFEVPTIRLDTLVDEPVRFLKIDTQGAELEVLKGAGRLISNHMVDILHIEFDGSEPVIEFMKSQGYHFLDSECVLAPKKSAPLAEWDVLYVCPLSTGDLSLIAWPRRTFTSVDEYNRFLTSQSKAMGYAWTDLIAVSPKFISEFLGN